jgi:hypothetical protein
VRWSKWPSISAAATCPDEPVPARPVPWGKAPAPRLDRCPLRGLRAVLDDAQSRGPRNLGPKLNAHRPVPELSSGS